MTYEVGNPRIVVAVFECPTPREISRTNLHFFGVLDALQNTTPTHIHFVIKKSPVDRFPKPHLQLVRVPAEIVSAGLIASH